MGRGVVKSRYDKGDTGSYVICIYWIATGKMEVYKDINSLFTVNSHDDLDTNYTKLWRSGYPHETNTCIIDKVELRYHRDEKDMDGNEITPRKYTNYIKSKWAINRSKISERVEDVFDAMSDVDENKNFFD